MPPPPRLLPPRHDSGTPDGANERRHHPCHFTHVAVALPERRQRDTAHPGQRTRVAPMSHTWHGRWGIGHMPNGTTRDIAHAMHAYVVYVGWVLGNRTNAHETTQQQRQTPKTRRYGSDNDRDATTTP
ncbi:hypothetical protein K443DRAFT_15378 [Laccaria amethystina LaAM-08-1]|uniref:Uncharacterized protein n=1 Tax=Laccaria amethystina LaAM-08-1 TaxID=1095629 RepID=A0A0C9WXY9_9AGAR|nr:hypothetical protein K443DRAFT_15378 [Laccaria amethystina LaAM-08-1]